MKLGAVDIGVTPSVALVVSVGLANGNAGSVLADCDRSAVLIDEALVGAGPVQQHAADAITPQVVTGTLRVVGARRCLRPRDMDTFPLLATDGIVRAVPVVVAFVRPDSFDQYAGFCPELPDRALEVMTNATIRFPQETAHVGALAGNELAGPTQAAQANTVTRSVIDTTIRPGARQHRTLLVGRALLVEPRPDETVVAFTSEVGGALATRQRERAHSQDPANLAIRK